jgi:hypothetical protein
MDDADLRARADAAAADEDGQSNREATCRAAAAMFRDVGAALWVSGNIVGPDRVEGTSPFGYGNDGVVGLATISQVAGELTAGAVALLDQGNLYGAAALLRQVVEVEYLGWAFAEDPDEAAAWIRSTKSDRWAFWSPARLRKRAGGRFRGKDYGLHCERGGHPTPIAGTLLPHHSDQPPVAWWWLDLTLDCVSLGRYLIAAAARLGVGDVLTALDSGPAYMAAVAQWEQGDPLREFTDTFREPTRP